MRLKPHAERMAAFRNTGSEKFGSSCKCRFNVRSPHPTRAQPGQHYADDHSSKMIPGYITLKSDVLTQKAVKRYKDNLEVRVLVHALRQGWTRLYKTHSGAHHAGYGDDGCINRHGLYAPTARGKLMLARTGLRTACMDKVKDTVLDMHTPQQYVIDDV